jgi:Mrp family chromosome partitioning ATPase
LHRVLGASRKPGLTDFLAGDVSAEAITQTTAYPGLSFIGCGARRRGGPELLSSSVMARFITDLRTAYDVIIIDSSPLAAGIDPYALATLTGNLLLVLRTGVTDRQLAEAKLDLLARLPVRVLGSVINDVRPTGEYNAYSYYLAGYELEEEVASPPGAGRRIMPRAGVEVGAGSGGDR